MRANPFLSLQFAENKFQAVSKSSTTNVWLSFILVVNYLRNAAVESILTALTQCNNSLSPFRHFAEIMALPLGRCHSRIRRNRTPYHRRVRADKQWRRTIAALDRRQWILSYSLIRTGTHIASWRCVSPCTRIFSIISENLSSGFSIRCTVLYTKNLLSFCECNFSYCSKPNTENKSSWFSITFSEFSPILSKKFFN